MQTFTLNESVAIPSPQPKAAHPPRMRLDFVVGRLRVAKMTARRVRMRMAGNNSERVFSKRSSRVNTAFGCGENIPFVRGAFTHHAPDERNLFFQWQRANVQRTTTIRHRRQNRYITYIQEADLENISGSGISNCTEKQARCWNA
jgi:hypothetical protein